MAIQCAYCNSAHDTAREVRDCWQRQQSGSPTPAELSPTSPDRQPIRSSTSPPPIAMASTLASLHPGPDELGRWLIIRPGFEVPPPWTDADRVIIDRSVLADPDATVALLLERAGARQRLVIELDAEFHEPPRSSTDEAPYKVGARFWFALDLLHHLVFTNSIDLSDGTPRWALLDAASGLGATPTDDSRGDIELPDGGLRWLDGGPICRTDPISDIPVVHAVAVEHGSLRPPSLNPVAESLAPDQLAAVAHAGASARIIAPAGSGKTRVLTARARHILEGWNIPASAVSLVAFNKRAQEEMVARTTDLRGVRVRTLNAIALAIVNGSEPFRRQSRTWRTIDEVTVRRIIGRLVGFPRKRNTDPVAAWIEALSVIRLGLRPPHEVEAMYGGDVNGLSEMWPRYRAALEQEGGLDFDEQIYRAIELLLQDPDTRLTAQRACRLLLVDEFQDLTPAHVLLVRLLSAPGFGVFGVGDDDQTIYGFSGASPSWLIDFGSLFPHAGAHPLEVNYRCPADVVQAADRLVRHNRQRVDKVIRPAKNGSVGLRFESCDDTLIATTEAVTSALAEGHPARDIAVLTRVNALLAPVQVALLAEGVPVNGGVGSGFVERAAVRAALAWLRLAVAPDGHLEPDDLAEALRRPSRPMHPNVAKWVAEQHSIDGLHRLSGRVTNERDSIRIAEFADDIVRLQRIAETATTARFLRTLSNEIGLGSALATLDDGRHGMNRAAQNDDLTALAQLARLQPDASRFGSWLRQQLSLPRSEAGVTLATVHRVKGQEWPAVVLHHCEADQYPHRLAEDLEEERRVFHVAITRGSSRVVVINGAEPSPFIAEMSQEPPPFDPAERNVIRSTSRAPERPGPPASDSAFPKGSVLAAAGLVVVDAGQEWVIEAVDDDGALARFGPATRRFPYGSQVITPGKQRGKLTPSGAGPGAPGEPSIRAYDLLRRVRDELRDGKPAYVVFDDATLERLALALPSSLAELGRVKGIGPAKLEQYGDAILVAIEDARAS